MSNIQNLCILRLSAIGDVCHAAAMVSRIRQQAPHIQITWVIGKIEHQLVGDMPGVEFAIFDKALGLAAYQKLRQQMRGRRFDALCVMQVALRANLAAACIPAKRKIGFDWARSKELHWLFTNQRIAKQKHAHVLDGFMAFADALAIPAVSQPSWDIPIPVADAQWAQQQTQGQGNYVVICPAASKAERNWTAAGYAAVAEHLTAKGYRVLLCGGSGKLDREISEQVMALTSSIALNLVGHTSLKQLLAVLKGAALVIAPDTGPAHMASTVGTPVLGLYAHSNPRRTGPYHNIQQVVSVYEQAVRQQYGKSWQQLPWGTRVKGQELMQKISTSEVIAQLGTILNKQH